MVIRSIFPTQHRHKYLAFKKDNMLCNLFFICCHMYDTVNRKLCLAWTLWFCVAYGFPVDIDSRNLAIDDLLGHDVQVQPMNLNDGQSVEDKIRVMRALAGLERRIEELRLSPAGQLGLLENTVHTGANYIFEKDIILTPEQAEGIYSQSKYRQKRKMTAITSRRWHMPIFYFFDGSHNSDEKDKIRHGIESWKNKTCVDFKESSGPVNNISINQNNVTLMFSKDDKDTGCWSYVGRLNNTSDIQHVAVSQKCLYSGSIAHELGHVIGFWHEHSRPDRDDHVDIKWQEIKDGQEYNFFSLTWRDVVDMAVPYDLGSLMHYSSFAYTETGNPTVVAKNGALQRALGQRHALSFYDIKLANMVYCSDICKTKTLQPCNNGGYQNPNNCDECLCPEGFSGTGCETNAPSVPASSHCGGDFFVTSSKRQSIGHTPHFGKGFECNWVVKAPAGMNVFFELNGSFVDWHNCFENPYVTCDSYLEVKYALDQANTGARFCCSLKQGGPIASEGNQMTILLRGHNDDVTGFQANVWAETCGGCSVNTSSSRHSPCYRTEAYSCTRSWQTKEFKACGVVLPPPDDCNQDVLVTKSRTETCYRSAPYCCDNFTLVDGNCQAMLFNATQSPTSFPSSNNNNNSTSNVQNEQRVVGPWSTWSQWSPCSQTCGGCGIRSRNRTCIADLKDCGNRTYDEQTENCSAVPCPRDTVGWCTRLVEKKSFCNPFSSDICTTVEKETFACSTECCSGYLHSGDICVLDTT